MEEVEVEEEVVEEEVVEEEEEEEEVVVVVWLLWCGCWDAVWLLWVAATTAVGPLPKPKPKPKTPQQQEGPPTKQKPSLASNGKQAYRRTTNRRNANAWAATPTAATIGARQRRKVPSTEWRSTGPCPVSVIAAGCTGSSI